MVNVNDEVDVCVIGSGIGASIAKHLTDAMLKCVLLEAGPRLDPNKDFSDLPFDMGMNKFTWPLYRGDRYTNYYMVDDDNVSELPLDRDGNPKPEEDPTLVNQGTFLWQVAALGGTTLAYAGNHPRASYWALDEWDDPNDTPDAALPEDPDNPHPARWRYELDPYYSFLEDKIPIPNAPMGYGPLDTASAMVVAGARAYGQYGALPDDDVAYLTSIPMFNPKEYDPAYTDPAIPGSVNEVGGYRGQPNVMTPECWHCGNCLTGCHNPINAKVEQKVKRSSLVAFVTEAEKNDCEVRTHSMALAILHPQPAQDNDGRPYPIMVVYGNWEGGKLAKSEGEFTSLEVQPCTVAVLSAGVAENPRIHWQSNLLLQNDVFRDVIANALDTAGYSSGLYIREISNGDEIQYITLPENDDIGHYFFNHPYLIVTGVFDKPVDSWYGQVSQSRVEVGPRWNENGEIEEPGLGEFECVSFNPDIFTGLAFVRHQETPEGDYDWSILFDELRVGEYPDHEQPYFYPFSKFGVGAKQRLLDYRKSMYFMGITDDRPIRHNKIYPQFDKSYGDPEYEPYFVDTFKFPDLELKVPKVAYQYHVTSETREKVLKLGKVIVNTMKAIDQDSNIELDLERYPEGHPLEGKEKITIAEDNPMFLFHYMGGMCIGRVVNTDCELIDNDDNVVERVFVAGTSVFPNDTGGANVAHTGYALAIRTAEALAWKYKEDLFTSDKWKQWMQKQVGTGHFLS